MPAFFCLYYMTESYHVQSNVKIINKLTTDNKDVKVWAYKMSEANKLSGVNSKSIGYM